MSSTGARDLITVTALQLRTSALDVDHWQRPNKAQPLLCTLNIKTNVAAEADTDSLLGDSLNYGTVTKAIEAAVAALPPASEQTLELEVLAELLAKVVIFKANAPNVHLELSRPRALLTAEAIGVSIFRTREDYTKQGATFADYTLNKSANTSEDKFFVKALRRLIIIGLNACELVDEQEVICDFEFYADTMQPLLASGARAGWQGWRQAVRKIEAHLTASKPLTIEHCTTDIAEIILKPVASSETELGWNVPRTTVRVAKPVALMFARHPAVQITRTRADFPSLARAFSTAAAAAPSALHTVILGVGTNMGDRVGNIDLALKALEDLGRASQTKVVDTSFLYESEAMYVTEQAHFLNATVKIETLLEPQELLEVLKEIEVTLGRQKTIRNGPRPIDLDILYFDNRVSESHKKGPERWLQIPHKSIVEREFVLRPLADLIPDFVHPALKKTSKTLLSTLLSTTPSTLTRVLPLSPSKTHPIHPTKRTLVMSILNATPDSFSDGGDHFTLDAAVQSGLRHLAQGVDILDVGGMSTRPGAAEVSAADEIARVVPLIKALAEQAPGTAISIDTFRPEVARAAVEAGATIINDVLGGAEPGMLEAMAELGVPVVLMHSRGTPSTMSSLTSYEGGVVAGVRNELEGRVKAALAAGVRRWNIILDPGIGFAKTAQGNLDLLKHLPESLGRGTAPGYLAQFPSLVGLSRKKFIGTITGQEVAKGRVWGTAAGVTASVAGGADVVRVHDAEEMVQVVKVADAIYRE